MDPEERRALVRDIILVAIFIIVVVAIGLHLEGPELFQP